MSAVLTNNVYAGKKNHIIKTDDISSIIQLTTEQTPATTLVFFDLDHTLLKLDETKHDRLDRRGYVGIEHYCKELHTKGMNKEDIARHGMKLFIELTIQDPPSMILVDDKKTCETFNEIKKHHDTMILTGRPWAIHQQTVETLNKNNLYLPEKLGKDLNEKFAPQTPCQWHDGIIYTAMQCKKKAFLSFFCTFLSFPYSRIIFIDDSENHVRALSEICTELNLGYLGIVYTKMHRNDHTPINYSQEQNNQEKYS